ncbi:MAG: NPCBM/NEW2 domain-containing protein [Sedimentisphaerales bacterium]|nr:NPCBM/NEW2 domain-containing protein [Sedimentisphaerales bacterium]
MYRHNFTMIKTLWCSLFFLLPVSSGYALDAGKTYYLSQIEPVEAVGTIARDCSVEQTALSVGWIPFNRGIGVKAGTGLVFDVTGYNGRFEAWVGLDMRAEPGSSVQFQVFTDDTLVFDSGIVAWPKYASSANNPLRPIRVSVSLEGTRSLRLAVGDAGDGGAKEYADWGDARLVPMSHPEYCSPQKTPSLALTPPMGWNSWNCFGADINEAKIMTIADAMAASGMRDSGYVYLNLDDGWQASTTCDAQGVPQYNTERFPKGMKALADYIHSKGLKFGIYSRPAWVGDHETVAAKTFADWGVDFIKYDFSDKGTNQTMIQAIQASGRPIVYGVCEWGKEQPWEWAGPMGAELWRTTYDVVDRWFVGGDSNRGLGILDAVHQSEALICSGGRSGWHDPDMLIVGLNGKSHHGGGCTQAEYRSQFSLWCLLSAPLLAGNDVRSMDAFTKETLLNHDLIAVNQDALAVPAWRVKKMPGYEIWKKPMKNGDVVIGLLNLGNITATREVSLRDILLKGKYQVRDLWDGKDIGPCDSKLSLEVQAHQTRVLRFSKIQP